MTNADAVQSALCSPATPQLLRGEARAQHGAEHA